MSHLRKLRVQKFVTNQRLYSKKFQLLKKGCSPFISYKLASCANPLSLKISISWTGGHCCVWENTREDIEEGGSGGLERFPETGSVGLVATPQLAHAHSPGFRFPPKYTDYSTPPWFSWALFSLWPPFQLTKTFAKSGGTGKLLLWPASAVTGLLTDSDARYLTLRTTCRRSLIHQMEDAWALAPTNEAFTHRLQAISWQTNKTWKGK